MVLHYRAASLTSLLMEFRPSLALCRSNFPASRCRHPAPSAVSGRRRVCRQESESRNYFIKRFQFFSCVGTLSSQRPHHLDYFDGCHAVFGLLFEFQQSLPQVALRVGGPPCTETCAGAFHAEAVKCSTKGKMNPITTLPAPCFGPSPAIFFFRPCSTAKN